MSDKDPAPSWLTEDNISTAQAAASNPIVQKAAVAAASNPIVQEAAKFANSLKEPLTSNEETPGWATGGDRDVESGQGKSEAQEFQIDELTLKRMQKYHLILRIGYTGASVFLAAAAVLSLSNQEDFGLIFFAFYVFFFSILMCCFEFALTLVSRMIAENFGFMYTLTGRFLFIVLVGFMSYSLGFLGKCAMGGLFAVLIYHAFVMWKFPRFEEYLRKKHYTDGSRD